MTQAISSQIKCAMFDFGNVIGIFDTASFYDELRRSRTIKNIEPEELLCGAYNEMYINFEKGEITDSELYLFFKRTLGLTLSYSQFVHLMYRIFFIDDEMVALLRDLKAEGIALVLVSNLNEIHESALCHQFPHILPLFDLAIFSHHVGYRKPDPRMWLEPMRRLVFKSNECVFVDDIESNVAEFRGLGGHAYHYAVSGQNYLVDLNKIPHHKKEFKKMLTELCVFSEQVR